MKGLDDSVCRPRISCDSFPPDRLMDSRIGAIAHTDMVNSQFRGWGIPRMVGERGYSGWPVTAERVGALPFPRERTDRSDSVSDSAQECCAWTTEASDVIPTPMGALGSRS